MTVYVDNAQIPYGRMRMCHLLADSLDELHAMADHIGVARRWFQGWGRASCPHYDICLSKRRIAVAAGAVEIDRKALAAMLPRLRRTLTPVTEGDHSDD